MSKTHYGQLSAAQLRTWVDEAAAYVWVKEENLFATRLGEHKPKHGQRVYRLWINGKFAGEFKTKRERREFIEMTRTLMKEGP